MSSHKLRVRRATTDDFQSLKSFWSSKRLPADKLERRLTEFQVVETADGQIAGAIGLQIIRQHALLHSEAYTDFSVADAARQLFWERIQLIASHHGVFRLWTQENTPFWNRCGFRIVITESLVQLPEEWKRLEGKWYTLQLKSEEAFATLEKELTSFRESEKQHSAQTLEKARTLRTIITVTGFVVGALCLGILIYLLVRRNPFLPPH
jgi:N-acetylglutamate synthase-like GNAT family acetyltransferase